MYPKRVGALFALCITILAAMPAAAAEKPLRSTTLASIASWAGVQIRLMAGSMLFFARDHCFTREARAPALRPLESAAPLLRPI